MGARVKRERFDELMESGALALAARVLADERLHAGQMVSNYRVIEEIGQGGMGVVYRAFDTKLQRDVALKVLVSGHRLWPEARAAASLKHPNIGVVYELGEVEGLTYMAMELLEGESLAQSLKRGTPDEAQAVAIATGVAQALAHAHDRGVVHKDLKPANIMLTEHGPKIIDFGLAAADSTEAPMGTPAYASPEQSRGEPVDERSDIYSFGVVLGEIHSGCFKKIPARCQAPRPEDRFQSVRDVLRELRGPARTGVSWVWPLALVSVAVGAVVFWPEEGRVELTNPMQLTSVVGVEDNARWAPDGGSFAFHANVSGNWDIWVAERGTRPVNLTVNHTGVDRFPSWSPSGDELAFWSDRAGEQGHVFVMSTVGGVVRVVAPADTPSSPQWSRDGSQLLFIDKNTARRFTVDGDEKQSFPLPGRNTKRFDLSWSPDERYVAYVDANAEVDEVSQVWVLGLSDGASFQISDGQTNAWSPSWSRDSNSVYFVSNRGGSMDMWRQPVGADSVAGEPEQLTVGVGVRNASVSRTGDRLVYSKGRKVANLWRVPLLDAPGDWQAAEQLTFDQALIEFVDVSPDGAKLVLSSDRGGNQDLWTLSIDASGAADTMEQLTNHLAPDWSPVWSPDGDSVAFYSYRSGNRDLWLTATSGGAPRQLTTDPGEDYRMAFSPDGEDLVFDSTRGGSWDIWLLNLASQSVRPLTDHAAVDSDARFAPDGSHIVFGSLRTGVYRLWELDPRGGGLRQLSAGPARNPRFGPSGRYIYFLGDAARAGNIWRLDRLSGTETAVSALEGRRGGLGAALATHGRFVYFTWEEDLADVWVMDLEETR